VPGGEGERPTATGTVRESVLDPGRWAARWDGLPGAARERLSRSIGGSRSPQPIHVDSLRHVGQPGLGGRALAIGSALASIGIAAVRFGDPCHPREGASLWVALGLLSWGCALAIRAARSTPRSARGIAPGRYLFPTDLIAIDRHSISVTPLAAVRSIERSGPVLTLVLEGSEREILTVSDDEVRKQIAAAVDRVRDAKRRGDRGLLLDDDVLAPARAPSAERETVASYRVSARRASRSSSASGLLGRGAALVLPAMLAGVGMGVARDEASDAIAVARLRSQRDAIVTPYARLESPELLRAARCYVERDDTRQGDAIRREIIAPLALAHAERLDDERVWRELAAELREGPVARRARERIDAREQARIDALVPPSSALDSAHRTILRALATASVRDHAALEIHAYLGGSSRADDADRQLVGELVRELRSRGRAIELEVVDGDVVSTGATRGPRLDVRWSLTPIPDRWIDESATTWDGAEARAELTLTVGDASWSAEIVTTDPAAAHSVEHTTLEAALALRDRRALDGAVERTLASATASVLAREIASAILPATTR
jgi:hypothetical protein